MSKLRNALSTLIVILGVFCIVTVIFSFTSYDQWWIRALDYPRLQITILSIVILLLSLIDFQVRRKGQKGQEQKGQEKGKGWKRPVALSYLTVLAFATIWQAYVLHPYFLPVSLQVPDREVTAPERAFSVLVANVLMENQEIGSYLDMVEKHDPDVVLVIEPDAWWTEQLAPLREQYDHHVEQPQDNHYGMNLYSRFPLSETEIFYFEDANTPLIFTVLTLESGDEVEFYGAHPRPPLPENSVSAADKELIKIAHHIKESEIRPAIVAGDLNDVPWSFTMKKFQEISQLRDVRVGRGFYNTFDAKRRLFKLPLDHIFITPKLGLAEIASPIVFSSDHKALFARFIVDAEIE